MNSHGDQRRALKATFCSVVAMMICHLLPTSQGTASEEAVADLIAHSGIIVSADSKFTIAKAIAVKDGKVLSVGADEEVLNLRGDQTKVVDLDGKMVLPGLIDSHVHSAAASMVEYDHEIPDMESIDDVLQYIRDRTEHVEKGNWIVLRQIFITRLREQRYPTKAELDEAAPDHPVAFLTGPDGSLNTLALQEVGIDQDFEDHGGVIVERNPSTGKPNGIVRGATDYLELDHLKTKASFEERDERLFKLLKDYNRVGITSVIDRSVSREEIEQFRRMRAADRLTVRIGLSYHVVTSKPMEMMKREIHDITLDPLFNTNDELLRIIGIKTYLDGGMLTGSAYMRKPWGISTIYGITDPGYRGLRYIPPETLVPLVKLVVDNDLQFTAHCVGDGAVHALLDTYEEVSKTTTKVASTHSSVTHSNFMSLEAIDQAARLKVSLDIQPAWLYLDTRTLVAQFGYDRLRYFQPLKTIFAAGVIAGGGSDHMQKIGSLRSVNPYNPFLGMWVTIARRARWYEGQLHPEEALTRQQAVRFYTWNNAYILRRENDLGSLEPNKLADFIIIDRDLLKCEVDEIKDTQVLATYLGGEKVYERGQGQD